VSDVKGETGIGKGGEKIGEGQGDRCKGQEKGDRPILITRHSIGGAYVHRKH